MGSKKFNWDVRSKEDWGRLNGCVDRRLQGSIIENADDKIPGIKCLPLEACPFCMVAIEPGLLEGHIRGKHQMEIKGDPFYFIFHNDSSRHRPFIDSSTEELDKLFLAKTTIQVMQALIIELMERNKSLSAKKLAADVITKYLSENCQNFYVEFDGWHFRIICHNPNAKAFSAKTFAEVIAWFKSNAKKNLISLAAQSERLAAIPETKKIFKITQK